MQNLWWAQKTLWVRTFFSLPSAVLRWGWIERPDSARDSFEHRARSLQLVHPTYRRDADELGSGTSRYSDPQLKSHDPPRRGTTTITTAPPPQQQTSLRHARIPDPLARGRPEDVLADDPPKRDRRNPLHVDDAAAQVQDFGARGEGRAGGRDARAAGAAAEGGSPGRAERAAEHGGQGSPDGAEGV